MATNEIHFDKFNSLATVSPLEECSILQLKTDALSPEQGRKVSADVMKDAIDNIKASLKRDLPEFCQLPHNLHGLSQLEDENFIAINERGYAVWFSKKQNKIRSKRTDRNDLAFFGNNLAFCCILASKEEAVFSYGQKIGRYSIFTFEQDEEADLGEDIKSLCISPENKLYALLEFGTIWEVNAYNFKENRVFKEQRYHTLCISSNGTLAGLNNQGAIELLLLSNQASVTIIDQFYEKIDLSKDLMSIRFSPDGTILIFGFAAHIILLQVSPFLKIIKKITLDCQTIKHLIMSKDNKIVIISKNKSLSFGDVDFCDKLDEVELGNEVKDLILSRDGKKIWVCDATAKFGEINFPIFPIRKFIKGINVELLHNEKVLIQPSANHMVIGNLNDDKVEELTTLDKDIAWLIIAGNSSIVYIFRNADYICKFDFVTKEYSRANMEEGDCYSDILCMKASKDGAYIAAAGKAHKVYIGSLSTMEICFVCSGHGMDIHSLLFFNYENERMIAAGSESGDLCFGKIDEKLKSPIKRSLDHSNTMIEVDSYQREGSQIYKKNPTGAFFLYIKAHDEVINTLVSMNDGKRIFTGSRDGLIKVGSIRCHKIENQSESEGILLHTLNSNGDEIYGLYITINESVLISASTLGKISFGEIENFSFLFHIELNFRLSFFEVTSDEKFFIYRTSSDSYEKFQVHAYENPLANPEIKIYGAGNCYSFKNYLKRLLDGKSEKYEPENDKWIILPYKINSLHIYAYKNYSSHLKQALKSHFKVATEGNHKAISKDLSIIMSNFQEKPLSLNYKEASQGSRANLLSIAISRNYAQCVNVIVKFIPKILDENPYAFVIINSETVMKLNKVGYASLNRFYDYIFREVERIGAPKLCKESQKTPLYKLSKALYLHEHEFIKSNDETVHQKAITFGASSIQLELHPGSSSSIEFLKSLQTSPNKDIFATKLIREILEFKGKKARYYIYTQAFVYLVYLVLFAIYILGFRHGGMFIPVVIVCGVLACYDGYQFLSDGKIYFHDLGNYVDAFRVMLVIAYSVILGKGYENRDEDIVIALLITISCVRGITYLRVFPKIRATINLFLEVFKGIWTFGVLLLYSTISFGVLFYLLDDTNAPFFNYFKKSYLINIGEFDIEHMNTTYAVCFFFATLVNPIIIMNLLIAILSDTYNRVQNAWIIADYMELAEMIIEAETLFGRQKKKGKSAYFHLCEDDESEEPEKVISDKVTSIRKIVKQNQLYILNLERKVDYLASITMQTQRLLLPPPT